MFTAACLSQPVWSRQVRGGRGEAGNLSPVKNGGLVATGGE